MPSNTGMLMTSDGYLKIESELKLLSETIKVEIEEKIVQAEKDFAESGDDSELLIAKDRQSFNESRIKDLQVMLSSATVVATPAISMTEVQFGSLITLEGPKRETMQLKIVGADEANIKKDKISIDSPAAKNLLGKKLGDEVVLHTANGKQTFKILELSV